LFSIFCFVVGVFYNVQGETSWCASDVVNISIFETLNLSESYMNGTIVDVGITLKENLNGIKSRTKGSINCAIVLVHKFITQVEKILVQ
jgi:hypothetical protein